MLPEQEELRRRIKAAMALADVTGYPALAEKTDYEYGTVKALGGARRAGVRHLRDIAAACEIEYAWFQIADVNEMIRTYVAEHPEALSDPVMRFAVAARREAQRRDAHPESEQEAPPDADEEDEAL